MSGLPYHEYVRKRRRSNHRRSDKESWVTGGKRKKLWALSALHLPRRQQEDAAHEH